ncbi:MAG: DNA topoisomerase IV subunit B, partial [Anaerolineae bacterium]|nr:DNA topoisomerase IV subunit B [Anaerolineae bacterium]
MVDKGPAPIRQQTDEDIRALDPMEHVRLRPGMYVGGTDAKALHHLVYEVVDNAIDEALAGRCDHIWVTLHNDNVVSVQDNGGGIPVGMNKETGRTTLEVVMTVIGAGGKFGSGAYKASGGLHGVGVSAVNALSEEMRTTVFRDGHIWEQSYQRGRALVDVHRVRPMEPGEVNGTLQTFRPDFTIMERNDFSFSVLEKRFREMAFVTRRVTITLRDERIQPIPQETTFYFEGGLRSFVRHLNLNRRG